MEPYFACSISFAVSQVFILAGETIALADALDHAFILQHDL